MNLKEFLKPSRGKILIFVLLITLTIITTIIAGTNSSDVCIGNCTYKRNIIAESAEKVLYVFALPVVLGTWVNTHVQPILGDIVTILIVLSAELAYLYLLSCATIFIYQKIKGVKSPSNH
ncbi:MAG: hypothetical protein A2939_01680 [Parcubacteria group bacterium RIFCSPLOWO2_01_FULL_48_18]|nr:MAG: hypothetical protein A2939_01680 [Parcubacteria group bacterium RIFCSPLOWO2_01_FULL_48_18]